MPISPPAPAHAALVTADGWTHLELTDPEEVPALCDAVGLDMAAEEYPLRDITRLTKALAEATSGMPGQSRAVSVSFWVRPADVYVEVNGAAVERMLLLKRYKMARISYVRRAGQLVQTRYRLVH